MASPVKALPAGRFGQRQSPWGALLPPTGVRLLRFADLPLTSVSILPASALPESGPQTSAHANACASASFQYWCQLSSGVGVALVSVTRIDLNIRAGAVHARSFASSRWIAL